MVFGRINKTLKIGCILTKSKKMTKPHEPIIELTKSFISRRYKINWVRIVISCLAVVAGIFIIYQVITKLTFLNKDNGSVFGAFITLAGLLLGTVALGLLNPALTTSEKINDAKAINKKMVAESEKPISHGFRDFFKEFHDILEKFYK
jgi:hypothetical protein